MRFAGLSGRGWYLSHCSSPFLGYSPAWQSGSRPAPAGSISRFFDHFPPVARTRRTRIGGTTGMKREQQKHREYIMRKILSKRNAYLVHRWLGLIVGVQLLAWSFGGFTFSILNIENVRGNLDRTEDPAPTVRADGVQLSPA